MEHTTIGTYPNGILYPHKHSLSLSYGVLFAHPKSQDLRTIVIKNDAISVEIIFKMYYNNKKYSLEVIYHD